jgi:hypothetical protein
MLKFQLKEEVFSILVGIINETQIKYKCHFVAFNLL